MAKARRKKDDDTTATMRRFVMLDRIPWEPATVTTTEMCSRLAEAGHHVEPRTVQRDLKTFLGAFHYTSEKRGNAMHWFWPRHCKPLNIRAITPATALILTLAQRHLEPLLPISALELLRPYFLQASETLSRQDPKRFASWSEKLRVIPRGMTFPTPRVSDNVQRPLFDALLADRQVKALYLKPGAVKPQESILHPLGIVSRDNVIYLVATAWDYADPFQYALHRFTRVEILADAVRRPDGFSLAKYVDSVQAFAYPTGHGRIALKIEIEEKAGALLLERPLSPAQVTRRLKGGGYRVDANVEYTSELRWWLLSFGPKVRVIGPAALKRDIAETLQAAAAQYVVPAGKQQRK